MTLGSRDVQARTTLVMFLYRETVDGISQALALVKQPPLGPEEKEALFGEVERAVWGFPDAFFVDAPQTPEEWRPRADDESLVRDALERGVTRILEARKRGQPTP